MTKKIPLIALFATIISVGSPAYEQEPEDYSPSVKDYSFMSAEEHSNKGYTPYDEDDSVFASCEDCDYCTPPSQTETA